MDIIHQLIEKNQGITITLAEIVVFTVLISLIIYHFIIYYGRKSFPEGKLYLYFSFLLSGFLTYIFLDTNLYFITISRILNTDRWTVFFTALGLCLIFYSLKKIIDILLQPDCHSEKLVRLGLIIYSALAVLWLVPAFPELTPYRGIVFRILWLITGIFIFFQVFIYYKNYRLRRTTIHFEVKIIIAGALIYIIYMWVYRIFLMSFPGRLPLWIVNNFLKIAMAFTFAYALARRFNREFHDLTVLKENLEKKVEESTRELRNAKDEIERESKRRTDYFIQVAHETKTPLTLIGNYLHRVKKLNGNSQELIIMDENIQLLRETMVRFLDAEKFGKGMMVYNHQQTTNLSHILLNKAPLFKDMAMRHQIEFHSVIEPDLCVQSDPLALERIINNLFDNAVKFTPAYGQITLTLTAENHNARLEMQDTGIGISKTDQVHIFRRYYQAQPAGENPGGLGMGLYIVKQTVESLKGTITLHSKTGKGSVFTVVLPLSPESVLHSIPVNEKQVSSGILKLKPTYSEDRQNICIVEDKPEMLSFLATELNDDYNVFAAENGAEALRLLASSPQMDLFLSDVMMKDEMDGYNFFESIRANSSYHLIPFIFLTARSDQKEKIEFLNRGATDYIYKPFSIDELKAKIRSVLHNTASQRKAGLHEAIDAIHTRFETPSCPKDKWAIFEARSRTLGLTDRQTEVIREVEKGYDYKQIAENLHVSQKTVHRHMQILFEKFNVHNKIDLLKHLFEQEN